MLKQRIITAIILIPIFIFLVLQHSLVVFGLATFLIVLIGAWEWSGLMEVKSTPKKIIYLIFIYFNLGSRFCCLFCWEKMGTKKTCSSSQSRKKLARIFRCNGCHHYYFFSSFNFTGYT